MVRSLPSVLAGALLMLLAAQGPAAAQDLIAANTLSSTVLFSTAPLVPIPAVTVAAAAATPAANPTFTRPYPTTSGRPASLPALYVMQGALQAMDAHSTFQAISHGAHEANPLLQTASGHPGAMVAVKAGVAASTIWMAERMWKRGNRTAAIMSMIVVNSATAIVVAHNYRVSGQLVR